MGVQRPLTLTQDQPSPNQDPHEVTAGGVWDVPISTGLIGLIINLWLIGVWKTRGVAELRASPARPADVVGCEGRRWGPCLSPHNPNPRFVGYLWDIPSTAGDRAVPGPPHEGSAALSLPGSRQKAENPKSRAPPNCSLVFFPRSQAPCRGSASLPCQHFSPTSRPHSRVSEGHTSHSPLWVTVLFSPGV